MYLVYCEEQINTFVKATLAATLLMGATSAHAALLSTNGSLSDQGVAAAIIAAPADANDDAASNLAIQAFDEAQNVVLSRDIQIDGGMILAGTLVSSHMIFLNSGPGDDDTRISHGIGGTDAATFTFDGEILGVMSDKPGAYEVASSDILGAAGTSYPGAAFNARGMEENPLSGTNNDYYSFFGNTIEVGMLVTEPGDWIRVVTVSAVPLPASFLDSYAR